MHLPPDATPHVSGGRLCLGIVNTVLWRRSADPVERLTSYADLVGYVARAGWLPDADGLQRAAARHPQAARTALGEAIELRETLFGLFSAVAAGRPPAATDLKALNLAQVASSTHLGLVATEVGGFDTRWHPHHHLDLPTWQVAASAGALLTSADRDRIKQCPGEQCGWVFVDESTNRSRRWCDSKLCGNRARVRAHYERSRAAAG